MSKGIRCACVTQPWGAGRSSRNRRASRSSPSGFTGTSIKTPTQRRFFLGVRDRRRSLPWSCSARGTCLRPRVDRRAICALARANPAYNVDKGRCRPMLIGGRAGFVERSVRADPRGLSASEGHCESSGHEPSSDRRSPEAAPARRLERRRWTCYGCLA